MIQKIQTVDMHLAGFDPFLFCAHHVDHYPSGNVNMGINPEKLSGRPLGEDFEGRDGFRMYHGTEVPGFPVHPHRGFETITIARQGFVDHADSLGAAGRFGEGDVQWMTAGKGVQHSEMFPLLNTTRENHLEIFQIWLNLPKKDKMVEPEFKMLWAHNIPMDVSDPLVAVKVINGQYLKTEYFESTQSSWAKNPEHHVNIFTVSLKKGGSFKRPQLKVKTHRIVYLFAGGSTEINGQKVANKHAVFLDSTSDLVVKALEGETEFLYLEGKPIDEPVAQYGPFVMNTKQDILNAIDDYNKTHFGNWKWKREDEVHDKTWGRFAQYPDGRIERP